MKVSLVIQKWFRPTLRAAHLSFLLFLQIGCQDILIFRKTSIITENIEVEERAGKIVLEARIDPPLSKETRFYITTSDDTATSKVAYRDYFLISDEEIILAEGESTLQIEIAISDDTVDEKNEQFNVFIKPISNQSESNSRIIDEKITVTIVDDDISLALSDTTVQEGSSYAFVRYVLSSRNEKEIRFVWSTKNGTASSSEDYVAIRDELIVIPIGSKRGALKVPLENDRLYEFEEYFLVEARLLSGIRESNRNILNGKVYVLDDESPPTITITNTSIQEQDGNVEATIDYSFSTISNVGISFSWSTSDGTAVFGKDYTAVEDQLVNVPAGSLDGQLLVSITNDKYYELDESFTVNIAPASLMGVVEVGSTLEAQVDISDDDPLPILTITGVKVQEGEGQAIINYSLNGFSDVESHFDWSTRDGSATSADGDYTSVGSSREAIRPGSSNGYLSVPIGDNLIHEGEEYFWIRIASLSQINKIQSTSEIKIIITDNDDPPSIRISSVSTAEQGSVAIEYLLSSLSEQDASFRWSTSDGTATSAGGDYTVVNEQSVTVPAGSLGGTLKVVIGEDSFYELNEYFLVNIIDISLVNINREKSTLEARVDITDSDLSPDITIDEVQVNEDAGSLIVSYTLSYPAQVEGGFEWSTEDGSATIADSDYTSVSNEQEIINIGSDSGTLEVFIGDNLVHEASEYFFIKLSSLNGIAGSALEAKVTILDNDDPPFVVIDNISVDEEETAVINFTLSSVSGQDTSFRWSTTDGTAISATGDYATVDGQLVTIDAGSLGGTLEVAISDDTLHEVDEHFMVDIVESSLTGIAPEGSTLQARVDIADNDSPPTLSVASIQVSESIGRTMLDYRLSSASGQGTSFRWFTSDGTATSVGDYTAISEQLITIPTGSLGGTLNVAIRDDDLYELHEYFSVNIIDASLVNIESEGSTLEARIDIIDGDLPPYITIDTVQVNEGVNYATVNYTLSSPVQVESRFEWSTEDGSATIAGGDYTSITNQQEIVNQGSDSGSLRVSIGDNSIHEANEYFWIRLSSLYGIRGSSSALETKVALS